jgi:hypothetical protein
MKSVAVLCPECGGASADNRLPPCEHCTSNGHFLVNRMPDGSMPETWDDGRPMVPHIPTLLGTPPESVWTLTHPRCT